MRQRSRRLHASRVRSDDGAALALEALAPGARVRGEYLGASVARIGVPRMVGDAAASVDEDPLFDGAVSVDALEAAWHVVLARDARDGELRRRTRPAQPSSDPGSRAWAQSSHGADAPPATAPTPPAQGPRPPAGQIPGSRPHADAEVSAAPSQAHQKSPGPYWASRLLNAPRGQDEPQDPAPQRSRPQPSAGRFHHPDSRPPTPPTRSRAWPPADHCAGRCG